MSLEGHRETIQSRHEKLDKEIAKDLSSPCSDDLEISKKKKEKLALKDKLNQLS